MHPRADRPSLLSASEYYDRKTILSYKQPLDAIAESSRRRGSLKRVVGLVGGIVSREEPAEINVSISLAWINGATE